jgi:predicted nucleic acid-binding protein
MSTLPTNFGSGAKSPLDFLRGGRVYFDANVFIYRVEADPSLNQILDDLWAMLDGGWLKAVTSELSLAEGLVGPIRTKDRNAQSEFTRLVSAESHILVLPIGRDTLLEAARLRALHGLEMPDAVHAATAKIARCTHFLTADLLLAQVVGARAVNLNSFKTLGRVEK